jgi:hypothetical protein
MVALLPSVAKASNKTKTALNNTTINEPMRLMEVSPLNRCANLHVTLATISPQIAIDAPALPVFFRSRRLPALRSRLPNLRQKTVESSALQSLDIKVPSLDANVAARHRKRLCE